MVRFTINPLTGLLILIIGIAFIVVAAVLFFLGIVNGMIISVISSLILIIAGSIIYFAGDKPQT